MFFEHFRLPPPDYNLEVGSGDPGRQVAKMIQKTERVLILERPDVVVVYGDTNSTLAGALAAVEQHLPVAHVEAGLRSFDMTMPEEVNRILVDHVSEYLFAPSPNAMKNLRGESCHGRRYLTGDVTIEILKESIRAAESKSKVLKELGLKSKDFILATVHRAENTDDPTKLGNIVDAMAEIRRKIIFPIHPRTEKALIRQGLLRRLLSGGNVLVTKPFGYLDFLKLEKHALKIITDSGGVQKEAYALGVPCITLRGNTEWVETVEAGWNLLAGTDVRRIVWASEEFRPKKRRKRLFGRNDASRKICTILRNATGCMPL